jgi:hypothetical protein
VQATVAFFAVTICSKRSPRCYTEARTMPEQLDDLGISADGRLTSHKTLIGMGFSFAVGVFWLYEDVKDASHVARCDRDCLWGDLRPSPKAKCG